MQKQIAVILIAILFIIVGLCGCNGFSSEENKFVGTWLPTQTVSYSHPMVAFSKFIFFSDGTFSTSTVISGTYEIKDGKLVLTWTAQSMIYTFDYSFSNDDNTLYLTITGGTASRTYTK